jgi:hypothetical protein
MRVTRICLIVVVVLVAWAAPALANDELQPYLERRVEAEFSGEQTIICYTPDGVLSEITSVQQIEGVRVVADAEGSVQVAQVAVGDDWHLGERYAVEVTERSRFLSRIVDVVEVMEGDLVRVVLYFDRASGALLASDVHNGDGSIYCSSRFVSFENRPPTVSDDLLELAIAPAVGEGVVAEERVLPNVVAGFSRAEAVAGPAEGVLHAYYEDGMFSFTLFASDRVIEVQELEDAPEISFNGRTYVRVFLPGRVIYSWQTPDGSYVLTGDLPLDLQEEVLDELPAPGRANFFVRFWRGLFG